MPVSVNERQTYLSQKDEVVVVVVVVDDAAVCVCVFRGKEDAISFGCLLGTSLGRGIKRKAALFLGLERGCGLGGAT